MLLQFSKGPKFPIQFAQILRAYGNFIFVLKLKPEIQCTT